MKQILCNFYDFEFLRFIAGFIDKVVGMLYAITPKMLALHMIIISL